MRAAVVWATLIVACFVGVFAFDKPQVAVAQVAVPQNCCTTFGAPTPSPTVYTYHGVQIYNGTAGVPDPQIAANISQASPDPNNSTILAFVSPLTTFANSSQASSERVNLAASPSPVPTGIQTSHPVGHVPPFSSPAPPSVVGTIPWASGYFIQGSCLTGCQALSDAHCIVLDTNTQFVYQGGGCDHFATGGAWFSAFNGYTDDLHNTYCSQQGNKGDNVTVSGLPLMGTTVWGEEQSTATGASYGHPIRMIVPVNTVASGSPGTNLSTLTTNSVGSCTGNATTQCLEFGDEWVYTGSCTLSTNKAISFCTTLATQGGIVTDLGASPVFGFGLDTNGVDQTDAATIAFQHTLTLSQGFIIKRGSIHC